MVFQVQYKSLKQGYIYINILSEAHIKEITFKDDYIEVYYLIKEGYNKEDVTKHKFYAMRKGDKINPLVMIDEVIEAKDEWILFGVV